MRNIETPLIGQQIPVFSSKEVLLCITDTLHEVKEVQFRRFAEKLRKTQGEVVPVSSLWHQALSDKRLSRNPFLSRVALFYPDAESGNLDHHRLHPLLEDLKSLISLGSLGRIDMGEVDLHKGSLSGEEWRKYFDSRIYTPTVSGHTYAEALKSIFNRISWGSNDGLFLAAPEGWQLTQRTNPKGTEHNFRLGPIGIAISWG